MDTVRDEFTIPNSKRDRLKQNAVALAPSQEGGAYDH